MTTLTSTTNIRYLKKNTNVKLMKLEITISSGIFSLWKKEAIAVQAEAQIIGGGVVPLIKE